MLSEIPVSDLKIGMYVAEVTQQKGSVKVSTKGWIKNDKVIEHLNAKGVLAVRIDPSKTLGCKDDKEIKTEVPIPESRRQAIKPRSVEKELGQADKLYQEAKNLQKKAFDDIKVGRTIDIKPIESATSELIDSIFRNQDALLCITRIREKDAYLLEHSLNVSILMSMFAKHLELEEKKIEQLATGAFLHDIGKILISDDILHKPGKLTDDEYKVMQSHVVHTIRILKETPGISDISFQVAAEHHEKLDGTGYPNNLDETILSQWGKMITIVDIYDALTAERVYKKGQTPVAAFSLMMKMTPNELDPTLLQQFIKCIGVHPVGTLVKLSSGKLGIVIKSNQEEPLKPIVKIFYHSKYEHHTDIKDIDLSKSGCQESIEASVKPEQFKIELNKFFREVLLT